MTEEFERKVIEDFFKNVFSKVEGQYDYIGKEYFQSYEFKNYKSEYISKLDYNEDTNTILIRPNTKLEEINITFKVNNMEE